MDVSVFQNATEIGGGSLEAAVKLAKGESIPKTNYIDFELVTQESVDEFIGINK